MTSDAARRAAERSACSRAVGPSPALPVGGTMAACRRRQCVLGCACDGSAHSMRATARRALRAADDGGGGGDAGGGGLLGQASGAVDLEAVRWHVAGRVAREPRLGEVLLPTRWWQGPAAWVPDPRFDIASHVCGATVPARETRRRCSGCAASSSRSQPRPRAQLLGALGHRPSRRPREAWPCCSASTTSWQTARPRWACSGHCSTCSDPTAVVGMPGGRTAYPTRSPVAVGNGAVRRQPAPARHRDQARPGGASTGSAASAPRAVERPRPWGSPSSCWRGAVPRRCPSTGRSRRASADAGPRRPAAAKAAAHGHGATVNDLLLAAVGHGARALLEARGELCRDWRCTCPSRRHCAQREAGAAGNRVAVRPMLVPLDELTPGDGWRPCSATRKVKRLPPLQPSGAWARGGWSASCADSGW